MKEPKQPTADRCPLVLGAAVPLRQPSREGEYRDEVDVTVVHTPEGILPLVRTPSREAATKTMSVERGED